MRLRRALLLALLVLLLAPIAAMAKGEPRVYVIKKGDTLWGVSERFIKDPYYWPNLWAKNPLVKNPHLIYPGQKLHIYEDRIELVPVKEVLPEPAAEPMVEAEPVPEPKVEALPEPEVEEEVLVRVPIGGEGFVTFRDIEDAGVLIDTVDNRIMIGVGDTVFTDMKDLASARPGDAYALFKTGKEVIHPVTGKPVGLRIVELGELQLQEINDEVATAVVTRGYQEIERGSRLMPVPEKRTEIALKKAVAGVSGVVIEGHRNKISFGQHDLFYVDIGSRDGLEEGNMLYVSRPRTASLLGVKKDVKLPERLMGAAIVVDVEETTATAVVLKSADAIVRGDRVSAVSE